MSFDFEEHKRGLVEHYARLRMTPGWAEYVDDRLIYLAEKRSFYADLPQLVAARVDSMQQPGQETT